MRVYRDIFSYFGYRHTANMQGVFNYEAVLDLPNHSYSFPKVHIVSTLEGLTRDWPEPLTKSTNDKEQLEVRLHLKPSQLFVGSTLETSKGNHLESELLFVNQEFSFGEIVLNKAESKNTKFNGLNISANIDELNVEEWIDHLGVLTELDWSVYETDSVETKALDGSISDVSATEHNIADLNDPDVSIEGATKDDKDEASIFKNIELNLNQAEFGNNVFKSVRADIEPRENTWSIILDGPDAKGLIVLPTDSEVLNLDFELLSLNSTEKTEKHSEASINAEELFKMDDLPELRFSSRQLNLNSKNYGSISFNIEKSPNRLVFKDINMNASGAQIEGQLSWESVAEAVNNSIFTGTVQGNDFSGVFSLFDVSPLFNSKTYRSDIGITWPDHPLNLDLAKMSGHFRLNAKEGFLNTDDSDTGILRLFGVLNAEAILRRLKLDFSDLYKSGVGFDELSLNTSIDQGLLTLESPLKIEGPSGDYTFNGVTDLASETLDLDMLVELPFSQNVPLAALVLGAPQIGGLVWVADKLLGEPLSALTTSRYDITGTWG